MNTDTIDFVRGIIALTQILKIGKIMPIYEYECTHCHHAFEHMQKISDAAVTHCEQCGLETATRLVSAAGFQLKGTGWYVTDFKDKPQKPSEKVNKPATPVTTAKGSTD